MLNQYLDKTKTAVYGLTPQSQTGVFEDNNEFICNDLLCYVYFDDIVNIRMMEVNSQEDTKCLLKIYNYNMNVDFDTLDKPTIDQKILTNNKTVINFDSDYFTLLLENLDNINNIKFYGCKSKYNNRRIERTQLFCPGGNACKREATNTTVVQNYHTSVCC